MDNIIFLIMLIFSLIIASVILLGAAYIFYKRIYTPHKIESVVISADEAIDLLNFFIKKELDLYERDIFKTKSFVRENELDNYYKDITSSIVNNMPASIIKRISFYFDETYIVSIICRTVMNYVKEKIITPDNIGRFSSNRNSNVDEIDEDVI